MPVFVSISELDSVELLVAYRHHYKNWEIKQFGIDGDDGRILVETSPLSPGVTGMNTRLLDRI